MKIQLTGTQGRVLPRSVRARKFEIEGAAEKFAVHKTCMGDVSMGYGNYSATHIKSGLRVAHAGSAEECIAQARCIWAGKTPEEISAAIERAMSLKNKQEN